MKTLQILVFILFAGVDGAAQTFSFSVKAQKLLGTFNLYHVNPPPNNEKVSSQIIDLFISELDNIGIILKESDIKALKKNDTELFNQVYSGKDDYVKMAEPLFVKALTSVDSILDLLWDKSLNFSENDTLFFLPVNVKKQYAANMKVHAKKIEKIIKYKSYERVSNTDSYGALSEKEFNSRAQEFSKNIISSLRKTIKKRMSSGYEVVESTLLNAIAQRYDPHSNYFTEEQNTEFSKQLSSTVESFGFQLAENADDLISIAIIEPGGSAWMSNEINEGGLFISVKIGNTLIRNEDYTASDVQTTLDNSAEKSIILTLKKPNGLIKTINLIKQKITSDENTVKGYVLKKRREKIGYLSLPSFYTDMGENHLPVSANDVAKEILKLEKDSIQGLIVDLRNNGGGSMQEAINLAGIFIDEGPLFIYKEKNKKPTLVKDVNRGSIFKKPLLVMINEMSASASELFSNIVKDYHMGLVVGQSSFGKGTAQIILPLDTLRNNATTTAGTNNDFIKITTGKFYRLNCTTHQGSGVSPDIELPSPAIYSNYKENKEPYYLLPDTVNKKLVYNPYPLINLEPIKAKSAARIKNAEGFNRLMRVSDSLSQVLNAVQKVPLRFDGYKKHKSEMENFYHAFENSSKNQVKTVNCFNNTFDKKLNEVNPVIKEFNLKILNSIEQDISIQETFEIMTDLINQEKK